MKVSETIFLKLAAICFLSVLVSCRPVRSFERTRHPDPPDYASEASWIALPFRKDVGDEIPQGCRVAEDQEHARADVFYIHPTVYLRGGSWNAGLKKKRINRKADKCVKYQATCFNACARVYAPRYRQAVLKSFFNELRGKEPLELAYEDVKKAFEYYLKNWNQDRPIIIAGHSQGAHHAIKLLKEFFDGKELQKKLIAAYPIGIPFRKDELKSIPISDNESQTGCYVTWNTFGWNSRMDVRQNIYSETPCVNPLTMTTDTSYAPSSLNKGGVSFKRYEIDEGVCDAKIQGHVIWIHKPKKRGYYHVSKSYHLCDYNLFYMNIRLNAILRTENYFKKK
ncbi:MAG: hypothetical protein K0S12_2008 [Bacteroidetes bacterium]|nr:hypothetical protein [Bacteroidota bacterium]